MVINCIHSLSKKFYMKNLIKKLFCTHLFMFIRNIYGDEINYRNARSIHKCVLCDKKVLGEDLW